jgi:Rod binding domain-containing protein
VSPIDPKAPLPLGAVDMDGGRIDALRRAPGSSATARRAAAGELEVMFLTQLLREMRRTVPQSDFLPPSPARTVYEGAFDRAVAGAMAERDPLGLVRTLGEAPELKFTGARADTDVGHQDRQHGKGGP